MQVYYTQMLFYLINESIQLGIFNMFQLGNIQLFGCSLNVQIFPCQYPSFDILSKRTGIQDKWIMASPLLIWPAPVSLDTIFVFPVTLCQLHPLNSLPLDERGKPDRTIDDIMLPGITGGEHITSRGAGVCPGMVWGAWCLVLFHCDDSADEGGETKIDQIKGVGDREGEYVYWGVMGTERMGRSN